MRSKSKIASAIIEQAATQIFMTNPKARAVDYVDGFGLTPHEYEIVRTLPDDAHCFLIKHGNESVVVRLNLTGERDMLTILSGRERTVRLLDEIRAAERRRPRRLDPAPAGARVMQVTCPAISDDSFLSSVLAHLDCQAQNLGAGGYQALANPGGPAALLLTGALTMFIALIGYRLLLGETPSVRDGVVAAIKVGVVLALATSWPAFRTLAYDVTLRAPAEMASSIGGARRPARRAGRIGRAAAIGRLPARRTDRDRHRVAPPNTNAAGRPDAAADAGATGGRNCAACRISARARGGTRRAISRCSAARGPCSCRARSPDSRACGWSPGCCSRSGRCS